MKRILAVDYGKRKIGLAISDELGLCAYPYGVIKNTSKTIDEIKNIVIKNRVKKVIVGIPYWDRPSEIVSEMEKFVQDLKESLEIDIELVNEFYSTKIAEEKVRSIGKKYKKVKKKIDSYAACVILQDYLEQSEIKG